MSFWLGGLIVVAGVLAYMAIGWVSIIAYSWLVKPKRNDARSVAILVWWLWPFMLIIGVIAGIVIRLENRSDKGYLSYLYMRALRLGGVDEVRRKNGYYD